MAYAKIENGAVSKYPYRVADMHADFPDVDFSGGLTDEVLAECSAVVVKRGPVPSHSASTHVFTTKVELGEDGSATAVVTAKERNPEQAAHNLRRSRDIVLKQTDWVVTRAAERGEPVPLDYATYRQALRDITKQDGFPFNVQWPDRP